jgi:DNA invertase Pin-like site-specific DNA recombinase
MTEERDRASAPTVPTKVTAAHLQRKALLYVRQSTLHQVLQNTESTQRQYALKQRAVALGWPLEQVHVIDCDLGHSGASAVDREGFQQLVTEVSLGRAGLVLGLEVSRLARNSADWQRLLELCALTDTLILDEDGLYDCNDFNDRLLLGMKGTLSEAELHFLRARLRGGILSKARRGQLASPLPVGFLYDEARRVRLDPDQQVQKAFQMLFATFRRTGAAHATVQHFRQEGLQFPCRVRSGPRKGELVWQAASLSRVLEVLHNPRYAGAFCFGRTRTRVWPDGKPRTQHLSREDWLALIPNLHEGYITWEEYEENQRRLHAAAQARGVDRRASPPREGPALLQGLVLCGVCGQRMTVRYHVHRGQAHPDYLCQRASVAQAAPVCQHLPGQAIDAAVVELLLTRLNPLDVAVTLAVEQELATRQEEADALRAQQVMRAQYEADLAGQRYRRVDPDNRLVAASLEAEWNTTLRALQAAQEEYERQRERERLVVNEEVRSQVMALTHDLPRVWHDPHTTDHDRKRLVRLLLEDVTLIKTHEVIVQVRFRGGATETLHLPLTPRSWQTWVTSPEVVERIDALLNDYTDAQIATRLNESGLHAGKGGVFHARLVAKVRRTYGLKSRYLRLREAGFLTAEEMAQRLGVSARTVKTWQAAGLLRGQAYDDKPSHLYERPGPNAPSKCQGRRLAQRRPVGEIGPERTEEVQCEG